MSRVFMDRPLDTVASWWRVFRTDGVTLGFTTHDRDLCFGGIRHRAAPGMLPSAIRQSIGFDDDGVDIEGALSHDSIAARDLAAGRFDGAQVEAGVVDWETLEAASLFSGAIASVGSDGGGFSAQLRSAKGDLDFDPVPRSGPSCRARFCGPGCGLNPQAHTVRKTVAAVNFAANRVTVPGLVAADYAFGEVRWIDGPQTGIAMAVIRADAAGLVLDRPLDAATGPGLRIDLKAGCDRTIATCAARFGNAINFQGEPFLPGNDLLAQYPVPR